MSKLILFTLLVLFALNGCNTVVSDGRVTELDGASLSILPIDNTDSGSNTENSEQEEITTPPRFNATECTNSELREAVSLIQYFSPRRAMIFFRPNMPETVTFYPFGLVGGENSFADFVIFVSDNYRVKQGDNVLVVTPKVEAPRGSPVEYLAIAQVADITMDDMAERIMDEVDINMFPDAALLTTGENSPNRTITLVARPVRIGELDIVINITENGQGGVFILTNSRIRGLGSESSNETYFRLFMDHFSIIDSLESLCYATLCDKAYDDVQVAQLNAVMFYEDVWWTTVSPHSVTSNTAGSGYANFVVYTPDGFSVEQVENLMRITFDSWGVDPERQPVSLEIVQIPNTSVSEVVNEIMTGFELHYDAHVYVWEPSIYFPVYEVSTRYIFTHMDYDPSWHIDRREVDVRAFVKDNDHGGVFVMTKRFPSVADGTFGLLFNDILRSLTISDQPKTYTETD